jgi:environmental stress-induced protein Ves
MKILRASTHKAMPWKNGGGETAEIAVFPEGASMQDFGWRVSMAKVTENGPFSLFPDIDRTLSILEFL